MHRDPHGKDPKRGQRTEGLQTILTKGNTFEEK